MAKWAVVLFIEEESVEAVPTNWLRNVIALEGKTVGSCLFPRKNATELAKKGHLVDDKQTGHWEVYAVEILGENYATYEIARFKSIKAQEKTDLESTDCELVHKRVRKDKRPYSPSPSSKYEGANKRRLELEDDSSGSDDGVTDLPATPTQHSENLRSSSSSSIQRLNFSSKKGDINGPIKPNHSSFPVPYEEFHAWKRHVNNSLGHLKLKLESINENLLQLVQQANSNGNKNADDVVEEELGFAYLKNNVPLKSHEEVMKIEELLDQKTLGNLITHFSKIGGSSIKEATKRVLKIALTDEAAQCFSFFGLKNKSAFARLKLKEAIF